MSYYKPLLKIGLPVMVENFLQTMMTVVDSYLVATIGLVAVSAVSVAGNIIVVYQSIFIALGAAISAQVAQVDNKTTQEKAVNVISQSIVLTIYISIVFGILSIFFNDIMFKLLGTSTEVGQLGGLYLAWVGGTIVLLGLMTSLSAILRSQGHTQKPMYVSLAVNFFNAIFSSIGIFILGWGIYGVIIGMIFSRLIGVVLLWKFLPQKAIIFSWKIDKEMIEITLPAAGERLMMRAGDVVVVSLIVGLGTTVVAGHAIGEVLTQFNYLPGMSLATATVILTAKAKGKQKIDEIDKIRRESYWLALGLFLLISSIQILTAPYIIPMYTTNKVAIYAVQLVIWTSFLGAPMTTGTLINTALWQGNGQAQVPFYATSLGMWGIRIGLGYLMVVILNLGLIGVCLGTILDNTFRWFFLSLFYRKRSKLIHEIE